MLKLEPSRDLLITVSVLVKMSIVLHVYDVGVLFVALLFEKRVVRVAVADRPTNEHVV